MKTINRLIIKDLLITGIMAAAFFVGRLTVPLPRPDLRELCRRGAAVDQDVIIFAPADSKDVSRLVGHGLPIPRPSPTAVERL